MNAPSLHFDAIMKLAHRKKFVLRTLRDRLYYTYWHFIVDVPAADSFSGFCCLKN